MFKYNKELAYPITIQLKYNMKMKYVNVYLTKYWLINKIYTNNA